MSDLFHYIFIEVFLYFTGRVVILPFSSLLKIKENEDKSNNNGWSMGRYSHKQNNIRFITIEGLQLAGFIFWIFILIFLFNIKN